MPEKRRRAAPPSASPSLARRQAIARRRRTLKRSAHGVVVLLLLGGILATALVGYAPRTSPTASHGNVTREGGPYTYPHQLARDFAQAGMGAQTPCPLVVRSTGYANPLAGATVKPERIDQGVDYAGSGTLIAISDARVTYVATDNTGWPGAFIEYRLLKGPDAGCYVFYAEGVTPQPGLRAGQRVKAGEAVATIVPQYPTGFEIGWGAGVDTQTCAAKIGRWTPDDDQRNVASGAGRNFSALIAALGGPPGKVEG
jgi:murein DD-endopeptidase MepM/ murein hydrolase activator NlpD